MNNTTVNLVDFIVYATESDCLTDAPNPYRSLMHYLHFLTVPLYSVAIYVLFFKTPITLREYRKYLLWHTLGNFLFEIYISLIMLPVTYLPALVFRGAGISKYLNVSGLVQFYMLVALLILTGLSVMEMFKYRFNATISDDSFNKKLLQKIVVFFWVIAIFIPIVGCITLARCLPIQHEYKQKLWKSNPGTSIHVVCYNAVIAPPLLDPVFTPFMTLCITAIVTACTIVPHTTLTILARLEQLSKHLSKKTIELQRMLLISLFMQAAIHGIMLGAPVFTFVYAIMFSLNNNDLAYFLILLISFHGSISTVAMIAFTKPIRQGVQVLFGRAIPSLAPTRIMISVSSPSIDLNVESRNSFSARKKSKY